MLALTAGGLAAERKHRAPVSHEPLRIKLPQATPVQLSNGLTLLTIEDDRLPLAWVRFEIDGAGQLFEPQPGLADLTVSMLTQGSKQRSAKQIAEDAARFGATLGTGSSDGRETTNLGVSGLSAQFYDWLALTADALMNPAFPVDEFNAFREHWGVSLRMEAANAGQAAYDALSHVIYGSHPAGAPAPSPQELAALTPEMAAAWHRERYAPANTVLTITGRVRGASVASKAEQLLGAWKTPPPKLTFPPEPRAQTERRVILIDVPGSAQTRLAIGNLLCTRSNPDYDVASIANRLLGSGGNSRLERMEGAGQALSARSVIAAARFTGHWRVRASMRTQATAAMLDSIFAELRRLCDEPCPATELDEAKTSAIGRFALTLEQPSEVIRYSYQRYRYGFSPDYWDRLPARISALTPAEIQAVAQKYYQPEQAHIVAVGDATKLRPVLAKFGRVEN
jgi:zinc protease